MKLETIRKIASSAKYQNLYAHAKEINGIKLFRNEVDFSGIQLVFLRYLSLYHNLYTELAMDKPNLSEAVIIDTIRCDAYLYWKNRKDNKIKPLTYEKPETKSTGKVVFFKKKN